MSTNDYITRSIRIPSELLDQITAIANENNRSVNYVITKLLRKQLNLDTTNDSESSNQ